MNPRAAAAFAFFASLGTAHLAAANPGVSGYSGKPYNGITQTCATNCHGGGAAPTLTIDLPSALQAGASADVSITVAGGNTRTSMNAALSDGVIATAGNNTTIPFPMQTPGEVAAIVPPPSGNTATYKFSFVAPNKNGPITLWVAGMAANGSGTGGDGVATTTRTITISGATATPPTTPTGSSTTDPPPTNTPSDGGKPSSNNDGGSGSGDGDDTSSPSGSGRRLEGQDSAGGCATTRSTTAASGAAWAALAVVVALRRRRR